MMRNINGEKLLLVLSALVPLVFALFPASTLATVVPIQPIQTACFR